MLLKPSVNRLKILQNQTVIMGSGEAGDEKDPCKWFMVILIKFYPLQDDHIQTIRF
jgi:hypothetical protein